MEKQKKTIQDNIEWGDALDDFQDKKAKDAIVESLGENYSPFPTKIQIGVYELFLENKNEKEKTKFIQYIQAPGGSGKTLSFAVPAVIEIMSNPVELGSKFIVQKETAKVKGKTQEVFKYSPQVIILGDTKILIEQIADEIRKVIHEDLQDKFKVTTLYSGNSQPKEFGQILISTPKMLQTLIKSKNDTILVNNCSLFICDEAELLCNSFGDELSFAINTLKGIENIAMQFASATLTADFCKFVEDHMKGLQVNIEKNMIALDLQGVTQIEAQLSDNVQDDKQETEECYNEILKIISTFDKDEIDSQIIIFVNQNSEAEQLKERIAALKGSDQVKHLHGRMVPDERKDGKVIKNNQRENSNLIIQIYKEFKNGGFKVLVCSDIMARGIDIDKVGLVINVFPPRINCLESQSRIDGAKYMHRIARTGRYVKKGIALTYIRSDKSKKYSEKTKVNVRIEDTKEQKEIEVNNLDSGLGELLQKTVEKLKNNEILHYNTQDGNVNYTKEIANKTKEAVQFNQTTKIEKTEQK